MNDLIPVPFRDATLFLADIDGKPYTPMRPIVEGMGLAWQPQHRKLIANKQRWGVTIMVTPTAGGIQEAVCMPLTKLGAWLMTVSSNKVNPELRPQILAYQNECDEALWAYWTEGRATNPRSEPEPVQVPPAFAGTEFSFLASCTFRDGRLVAIGPAPATAANPASLPWAPEQPDAATLRQAAERDAKVQGEVKAFLIERGGERWTAWRLVETHGGLTGRFGCGKKWLYTLVRRAVDNGELTTTRSGTLRVPAVAR